MSAQLLKALGLKEDASEEEALKAIAEMAAKARRNGNGDDVPDLHRPFPLILLYVR